MKKNNDRDLYTLFSRKTLRIMKIMTLLLIFCGCNVFASTYGQVRKLSINRTNSSIMDVLKEIENNTDFTFFIYDNQVNVNSKVNVSVHNASMEETLDQMFGNTNYTYEIIGSQILIKLKSRDDKSAQQQKRVVSGTITDENGEALIGVTVIVKSAGGSGTMTDIDGRYSVTVPENISNPVLVFSYVGYIQQEIAVNNKTTIDVLLKEDTQMLDEIIVVGYGVQKRASITGSVASIQSKEVTTVKTPNVGNMLAGRLPGLRSVQRSGAPGDDNPSIDIRGFGNALVIVDGIERDFKQLDANDIESISVLKDASAAVYGFKGANGVILVTTKKGTRGKAKIDYSGYIGFQKVTRYPELMNGYEYASLYNEAQMNAGITAPYSEEQLQNYKNGIGTTDWWDATMNNSSPQMYHNLSVTGGSEKVSYYFSLGYTTQDGLYKSDDYTYDRYNIRSNISAEITKGLTIDLQLSGRLDTRDKPYDYEGGGIFRSIQMAKPVFSIYANDNPKYWQATGDKPNPVHMSYKDYAGYDRRDRREFNGSMSVNWQLPWVNGLSAKALLAYDYNSTNTKKWYKEYYEYVHNASKNSYDAQVSHIISELTNNNTEYFKPTQQYSLNYTNTFGNHDFTGLLLWEMYNDRRNWLEGYRQFTIGAIDQMDAGDNVNKNSKGNSELTAHEGLVGRLNYAYANRYLVELSFRYDGSYKFDPDKRWGFFPAVSLGWRVSEESFFKNTLPQIDNLKIRGSYGKVGDESYTYDNAKDPYAYQFLSGYKFPSGSYILGSNGLTNGVATKGLPFNGLTWYESKIANLGFEASALKGLISVEFDYFTRKREGLLANRILSLPTSFGLTLPQENLNSDKNEGFELIIGHNNKVGDFHYNVKANFSTTRVSNRYVERADPTNMYDNWRNNTNNRYKDISWGKKSIGQFQSYEEILNSPIQDGSGNKTLMPGDLKFEDWNNDGIIDGKDDQPIGHGNTPRMYYGINLSGDYKGFDITIFLQGAAGHDVFINGDAMDTFMQQGLGNGFDIWMDRWHREDSTDPASKWISGKMPPLRPAGFSANTGNNTWTMHKAQYLRLKTLEVGYTFPKKWIAKIGVDNLRIYFNSFNPFTFTKSEGMMKYMDPENNNSHLRYYPQTKTFNFGVNLSM